MLTQLTVFAMCIAAAAADSLEVAQGAVAKARWAQPPRSLPLPRSLACMRESRSRPRPQRERCSSFCGVPIRTFLHFRVLMPATSAACVRRAGFAGASRSSGGGVLALRTLAL